MNGVNPGANMNDISVNNNPGMGIPGMGNPGNYG